MRIKYLIIASLFLLALSFASSVSAQEVGRLQFELSQLQNKLNSLLLQVKHPQASTDQNTSTGLNILTRNLSLKDKGPDVLFLQKFLNSFSDTKLALVGLGSPGHETNLFGLLTFNAVKKFQEKYKSQILTPAGLTKGTGFVGPSTIKMIRSLIANKESVAIIPNNNPTTVLNAVQAPSNFKAAVNDGNVFIEWPAVPGVDYYQVERSLSQTGSYAVITSHLINPFYSDNSILPSSSYYYRVIAVKGDQKSDYSATIAITTPSRSLGGSSRPSFDVADQTISFGALTIASAGGIAPTATGGSITSATITSGNSAGHWQVASDGTITPTSTGDSANLNQGPYTLGLSFNGGVDTATITINIDPLTYDVASRSELEAAATAAKNLGNTADYTIYIRDGVDITGDSSGYVKLYGITMAGSLVDANNNASESSYDYGAKASFSGGSINLTARTPYSPKISGTLRMIGSTGIKVSKITFSGVPATDSYNRDDGGPNTSTNAASTFYQSIVENNGTYSTEPSVIFSDNKFGGYHINGNDLRWGNAIIISDASQAIIEDNDFDGVYIAASFASVKRGVARRNNIQHQLVDGLRAMGTVASALSSFTLSRIEFTSNVIWNMDESSDWAGSHSDGIQFGTQADEVDHDLLVKKNYIYLPVPAVNYSGEVAVRSSQGIYLDDTPTGVTLDGVIAENFIVATAQAGLTLWRGSVDVRNNTILKDTLHSGSTKPLINVANGSGHTISDNLVYNVNSAGGSYTEHDNYDINPDSSSNSVDSYYANFTGPFTAGSYGPTWVVDSSSSSTLVADINSIFTPKAGSKAETRGFTNTQQDRTPSGFTFSDLVNQVISTLVYTNKLITSIADNTFASSDFEWGTSTTSDYNSVSTWNSGGSTAAINNNQYLHLRTTTPASGGATSTGEVIVGAATTTWSVGTAPGAYAATAVDFDGSNDSISASAGTLTFGASSKGTLSLWFYVDSVSWPSSIPILDLRSSAGVQRFLLQTSSSGRMSVSLSNASSQSVFSYITPSSTFSTQTWYNFIVTWDASSNSFQAYKNGVSLSPSVTVNNVSTDWSTVTRLVGSTSFNGWLADVYLNTEEQVDVSNSSNLAKFIDSNHKPVNIGSNGATPTGSQPEICLTGAVATWHVNKGTAGGFTLGGSLTTAATSPSD